MFRGPLPTADAVGYTLTAPRALIESFNRTRNQRLQAASCRIPTSVLDSRHHMRADAAPPQPRITEILPGMLTILIIGGVYSNEHHDVIRSLLSSNGVLAVVILGVVGFILSWLVGTFLDSVREVSEWVINRKWPINWNYLFIGPPQAIERLTDWYLTYYFLSGNYAVGVVATFAVNLTGLIHFPNWLMGALFVALIIALSEFFLIRKRIMALIGRSDDWSHHGVYSRLCESPTIPKDEKRRLGVFAIADIRKGTYVFQSHQADITWVDIGSLPKLPQGIRQLYSDFGIFREGRCGVPKSFNRLSLAWYLNDSRKPNIGCDEGYRFFALQDIREGEELLADFSTYR